MIRIGKLNLASSAAMILAMQLACAGSAPAAQPSSAAARAYEAYLRSAEWRMAEDYGPGGAFISLMSQPSASASLAAGGVVMRCVAGCDSSGVSIPGGLIHDWVAAVFIPGASLPQVLAMVQDYDHAADHYAPSVTKSRLIARSGDFFRLFLQLKQTEVLTVCFNIACDVHYVQLDGSRVYSVSHSTRIAQLARGSQERELAVDDNDGFLWRLDSYWRFERVPAGVYVQCRAISLSRDIPRGLGWIVAPLIRSIPVKSLQFTLRATRAALMPAWRTGLPTHDKLEHHSRGEQNDGRQPAAARTRRR
jgi:hypothetical protein